MKRNKNAFLLYIVFFIGVVLNIYLFKTEVVIDDTVVKILSEKVSTYLDSEQYFLNKPLDFNDYYILFDEVKLNTNHFVNVFGSFPKEKLQIKKIYPYINPLYENSLRKEIGELTFINGNLPISLSNMIDKYIGVLNKYGFDEEVNKVDVYGINIRVVLINISNNSMYDFLKSHKEVKFSTSLDGPYYKIK